MKYLKKVPFYILIGLIPIGLLFRIQDWSIGALFFLIGFLFVCIFYIITTVQDLLGRRSDRLKIILQFLVILMSIVLFSKYLNFKFGDIVGLLIVPLFIVFSFLFLINKDLKDIRLTLISILYLLFSFPLFALHFHGSPREYLPRDWHDRYTDDPGIIVHNPYGFAYKETEDLSLKASAFKKSTDFYSAILFYREALKLEPKNPRLYFDISECLARVNNLELAISALDTAISIDSTWVGLYNNRGLLYYQLNDNNKAIIDFQKAIKIDSTKSSIYANIALAYYDLKDYAKACEAIKKAELLGMDYPLQKELRRIKKKYCK